MNRSLLLVLPLALALLLPACAENPAQLVERADRSLAAEDYAAARRDLAAALRESPDDHAILIRFARAQIGMADGEGALATIARIGHSASTDPALRRLQAEAELLRGRADAALALLATDGSAAAWRIRAVARLDRGDPLGALDAFARGATAGSDPRLLADHAWFLLSAHDLDGAEALTRQLRRMAPDSAGTELLVGTLAERRGQIDRALAAYARAAGHAPGELRPLLAQIDLLVRQETIAGRQAEQAQAAIAKAEALAPDDARVRMGRLRLDAARGRWEKVRDALQGDEAGLDPNSEIGLLYAEALLRIGQSHFARAQLGRALLMEQDNRAIRLLMSEAQLAAGDAEAALTTLRPLISDPLPLPAELALAIRVARQASPQELAGLKRRADDPDYRRLVALGKDGDAAMARDDWAGAIAAFTPLHALMPGSQSAAILAYALARAGRNAEAQALAAQALGEDPANALALRAGGIALVQSGQPGKAAGLLIQALRGEPRNLEAALWLHKAKAASPVGEAAS